MIPVLYSANTTDFSTFGLGVLTDTIFCEVTEERNGVFECLLKYPVSGQHYGLITKECIIKAKPNDTAADQAFRIYRITKPLNSIVTIYGQHISYDLANVPVMPFSTESRSPQLILSQLLAGDTRFTGRTDYSDAKAFSVAQPKSVRACLGGTEGSMLSKWYGEFEWDNFTVKFHSHRGQKTGVVIEYGKNLTALEQDEDNSGVYTALLPYAIYTPEGSDTEMVITLPEVTLPIVTSEIVRAKTLIMDFSDQFDGVVTEEALRAKANSYIKANPLGATIPTVKVSFEPLWKQPEYSALLARVNLCDTVTIRHSLLGVSVSAMVIETVYDTLAERYKSISLGQSKSSMITTISEVQSTVDKVESAVGRFPKLLQTAIGKATGLITGQSGGYVVIHTSEENGQPYAMADRVPGLQIAVPVSAMLLERRCKAYVFHAAALKQVPSCEFYPMEAVKTNVAGSDNVISACVTNHVKKAIFLSTDKAAYPINAMGMTKAVMEKNVIARSRQMLPGDPVLCLTRYGNVMASRGSVIPLFCDQIDEGKPLTITNPNMTRFMMTLSDAVDLVLYAFEHGEQGDLFVQKAPAATIETLAQAVLELKHSNLGTTIIGTRHGEKLFEVLVTAEEMMRAEELPGFFRIPADNRDLNYDNYFSKGNPEFGKIEQYTSHNTHRLNVEEMKQLLLKLKLFGGTC